MKETDKALNIEEWITHLLNDIDIAASYGEPYELFLSSERVHQISKAWNEVHDIEIN